MFNFFRDVKTEYTKITNRQLAEGIVAIMIGVSYADGELETAEMEKLKKGFRINPVLAQFDQSELIRKFNDLQSQFEWDTETGIAAVLKEIEEAARGQDEETKLQVLRMGVALARADGALEDAEVAFLRRAAAVLGVSLSQVGI